MIPFPPGSSLDIVGRAIVHALLQNAADGFVVENRAGNTGVAGARFAARSALDRPTWLFAPDTLVTAAPVPAPGVVGFEAERELAVAASLCRLPSVLVVNPAFKVETLAEFVAFARTNEVPFASGGMGSAAHLTMMYFGEAAGLRLRHIAYRGGNLAVADVITGQVPATFAVVTNALEGIRKGLLRPLAVSSLERLPALPDVPTVDESGFPNFDVAMAYFAWVPAQTSSTILATVQAQLESVLAHPDLQAALVRLGVTAADIPPAQALAWMQAQRTRWAQFVTTHALTPG